MELTINKTINLKYEPGAIFISNTLFNKEAHGGDLFWRINSIDEIKYSWKNDAFDIYYSVEIYYARGSRKDSYNVYRRTYTETELDYFICRGEILPLKENSILRSLYSYSGIDNLVQHE